MKQIHVTERQAKVLESFIDYMNQVEPGYSNVTFEDIKSETGLSGLVLAGVVGTLIEAGHLEMLTAEELGVEDNIFYLNGDVKGIVEQWHCCDIEPAELIIK